MSKFINMLLKEMRGEAETTRKMLSIVPEDKFDWKPHPRSMTLRQLATHIAELPSWVTMTINTDELDFESNPYTPVLINDVAGLLEYFEKNLKGGLEQLEATPEEKLDEIWTLRSGSTIYTQGAKSEFIRICFCQIVHHRAQLGVFLRLLDIPIPGSYGPSADDASF